MKRTSEPATPSPSSPSLEAVPAERLKDAFLEEVRKARKFFHGTVVAQAQRIEVETDRIVFFFGPQHGALRSQLEQARPLLETIATGLAGRKMSIATAAGLVSGTGGADQQAAGAATDRKAALREQALADSGVQAMLDVFAAEIRDVEEM